MFRRMVFGEEVENLRVVVSALQIAPLARWGRWAPKQPECQLWTARGRARVPRWLLSTRQAVHGCSACARAAHLNPEAKLEPRHAKG